MQHLRHRDLHLFTIYAIYSNSVSYGGVIGYNDAIKDRCCRPSPQNPTMDERTHMQAMWALNLEWASCASSSPLPVEPLMTSFLFSQ